MTALPLPLTARRRRDGVVHGDVAAIDFDMDRLLLQAVIDLVPGRLAAFLALPRDLGEARQFLQILDRHLAQPILDRPFIEGGGRRPHHAGRGLFRANRALAGARLRSGLSLGLLGFLAAIAFHRTAEFHPIPRRLFGIAYPALGHTLGAVLDQFTLPRRDRLCHQPAPYALISILDTV